MDILRDILGIPQLTIERVEMQETEIHLYVKLCSESAICPLCHKPSQEIHRLQTQAQEEKKCLDKYWKLLKMALVDKKLSKAEFLVLKMKRKTLHLKDEEARKVEQELGVTLPS